jgi:hypothetical protein
VVTSGYITDESGNKIAVVLPIAEYEALLEEIEMNEDIRAYKQAKSEDSDAIPIEKAFKELGVL